MASSSRRRAHSDEEPNLTCITIGFYLFAGGFTLLVILAFAVPVLGNIYL